MKRLLDTALLLLLILAPALVLSVYSGQNTPAATTSVVEDSVNTAAKYADTAVVQVP